MGRLAQQLSLAACTLIAAGQSSDSAAQEQPWEIDTSYLSYSETDRVTVSKTLANLARVTRRGTVSVELVHDTISGTSPTGAVKGDFSAVTFSTVSGDANGDGDFSKSDFSDTRIRAGLGWEQEARRGVTFNVGGALSQESDYESYGFNVGVSKDSDDKLQTFNASLAVTSDSIFRSDTGNTPQPLGNAQQDLPFSKGSRTTIDGLIGMTQVLNRTTVAQANLAVGLSQGYHSDPYKIISAADENNNVLANFHDSRPKSRLRTSLFGKIVHQLAQTKNSVHASYRLYLDDWGVQSHTADFRYRHQLPRQQYLEPHIRLYRQSAADFYQRKLAVDEGFNPVLPEDGFASADYRLDAMTSSTLGLKYGIAVTPTLDWRIRAAYIDQSFNSADYDSNTAVILQTSLKYRF